MRENARFGMRLTFKRKLILGFAATLIVFLSVALFNLWKIGEIKEQLAVQNGKIELKQASLELKEIVQELNVIANGLLISKKTEFIPKYMEKRAQYDRMIKLIGDTAATPEQIAWRSKLVMLTVDYAGTFDAASKLIQDKSVSSADVERNMEYLYNESQMLKDEMFSYVDNFYTVYSEEAADSIAASQSMLNSTANTMIAAFAFAVLLAAAISVLLVSAFVRPINRLQSAVQLIAQGDLRHKINSTSQDELGQLSRSFDSMIEQVCDMLSNTRAIALSLSKHSESFNGFASTTASANSSILLAMEEISAGTIHQAGYSETCSTTISELDHQIEAIVEAAETMNNASRKATSDTAVGSTAMISLREASAVSQTMLEDMYKAMSALSGSSKEIGKITDTIKEITVKTNVLALNASIEAARAGIHGKGFNVIADEVRELSNQTSQSAKTIGALTMALENNVVMLQDNMMRARATLTEQSEKTEQSLSTFENIRTSMKEVTGHVEDMHDRMLLIKMKNQELVTSIYHVASVAQQTAASSQEVMAASSEQDMSVRRIAAEADDMNELSQSLFQEISKFRMDHSGNDAILQQEDTSDIDQTSVPELESEAKSGDSVNNIEKELVGVN